MDIIFAATVYIYTYVCVSGTVKAHLLRQGSLTAEDLAGRLHGDILRGFMCAEAAQQAQSAPPLGRAPARLLRLLRARLTALASAALPGERPARWATSCRLGCSSYFRRLV